MHCAETGYLCGAEMGDESPQKVEDIWVNVTEGAQITGYNRAYIVQLAKRMWDRPEAEREIRIRKRTNGYDLWLPDLVTYKERSGRGPQRKRRLIR
jgi:hypothetical protein